MSSLIPVGYIQEALDVAGIEDAKLRDYSGRFMYGETCLGIVFDHALAPLSFMTALGLVQEYTQGFNALDLARAARMDEMGKGVVVYFPGWAVEWLSKS